MDELTLASNNVPRDTEYLDSEEKDFILFILERILDDFEHADNVDLAYNFGLIIRDNHCYRDLSKNTKRYQLLLQHVAKMDIPKNPENFLHQMLSNQVATDDLVVLPYITDVYFKVWNWAGANKIYFECHGTHYNQFTFMLNDLPKRGVDIILAFLIKKSHGHIQTFVDLYYMIDSLKDEAYLKYSIMQSSDNIDLILDDQIDYELADEQLYDRAYTIALEHASEAYEKLNQETLYD